MPMSKIFSELANHVARATGKPLTFGLCVLVVIGWAVSGPFFGFSDTWQLVINTATTIVTFLLVALLQNTQSRADEAVQQKLNAIADALADFMGELRTEHPELDRHRKELADAVGLEKREST